MKIGLQKRTKRYATRDLNRAGKIPVLESALPALCEKHNVTHSLPKGPNHFASAEDILQRIQRIREKQRQISEFDRRTIQQLESLVQSELTFLRVREIDEVTPQTEFVYCFEMAEELNGFITQGTSLLETVSATKDTRTPASAASNVMKQSTHSRGTSLFARWKSLNLMATRLSMASSIPSGCGPPRT